MSDAVIDGNYTRSLVVKNDSTGFPLVVGGLSLGGIGTLPVAILDGSGNQIVSFSGGTQYTDAASTVAHPIGTMPVYDNAGTISKVSVVNGLPIQPATGSTFSVSGTMTANAGTNLNTSALALETGGNLATIVTNTNKIPALGQALAAASVPVILPSATITTLTPPSNTGYALDSSLTSVATIGAKTDAKSTATDGTSTSIVSILKQISASVQAPPSQAVTNGGTFATQSAITAASGSIASGAIASGAFASGSVSDGAVVTLGSKTDAADTHTDGTSISIMSVLKEISAKAQSPATTPVTIATAPVLVAGTAVIGKVGIDQTTPGTTNGVSLQLDTTSGWTPSYQSALSSTKVQIKGTAGKFGGYINLYNPNTAVTYIQVWNLASASVTVGTTAPTFVITLPGIASASGTGSDRNLEITMGVAMSTGITVAATTTATGSTAPANAIVATFLYI